eukprot:13845077-Heterocapsa_arctica.AAC.1
MNTTEKVRRQSKNNKIQEFKQLPVKKIRIQLRGKTYSRRVFSRMRNPGLKNQRTRKTHTHWITQLAQQKNSGTGQVQSHTDKQESQDG